MIDQSGFAVRAYSEMTLAFYETLVAGHRRHVSVYQEKLDHSRFNSPSYRRALQSLVRHKYDGVRPEVIVAYGASALEFAISLRTDTWSDASIVFLAAGDGAIDRSTLPSKTTGLTVPTAFSDFVDVARALTPGLRQLVLVGDRIERQTYRSHFKSEIARIARSLELIDLTGLPVRTVRERVAALGEGAVIAFTTINIDGDGLAYTPLHAMEIIAAIANRPIVVDVETYIGRGAVGGRVIRPSVAGVEAAKLVTRILEGEDASQIPIVRSDALRMVFDWNQLQRWKVSESQLPADSEVRFRASTFWEQHYWRVVLVSLAFVLQTALIVALLYEDRRRRRAEMSAMEIRSELAHMDRIATAGELSASIAHEIRQPLTAIVAQGGAGLRWLARSKPELDEARHTLESIVKEGHRAAQVIEGVRELFLRGGAARAPVDVNAIICNVLDVASTEIKKYDVVIKLELAADLPTVNAIDVQLRQVILNLAMNAIQAMAAVADRPRMLRVGSTLINPDRVAIEVEDSGPGIDPTAADRIFKPFFTTKPQGMGLGLSICKSIIESHGGTLTMTPGAHHGAVFRIVLPRSEPGSQ